LFKELIAIQVIPARSLPQHFFMGDVIALSPEFEVEVDIRSESTIIGISELMSRIDCISHFVRTLSVSKDEHIYSILEDDVISESLIISYSFYSIGFLPVWYYYSEGFSLFARDVRPINMSATFLNMLVFCLGNSTSVES